MPFFKQWYESWVKDFLVLFSVFVREKVIKEIVNKHEPCIQHLVSNLLQISCKLEKQ